MKNEYLKNVEKNNSRMANYTTLFVVLAGVSIVGLLSALAGNFEDKFLIERHTFNCRNIGELI